MYYFDEEDALLQLNYETTVDDYYEYLKEEDIRDIPVRKQNAKERFIFQIVFLAVVVILVLIFGKDVEPLVYLVFLGIGVLMTAVFIISYYFGRDNVKSIQSLLKTAHKKTPDNVPVKLSLFEHGIVVTELGKKWIIKGKDIEAFFETENLLAVDIKYGREIAASDIEKVLITKRALNEEQLQLVRETIGAMVQRHRQELAKNSTNK